MLVLVFLARQSKWRGSSVEDSRFFKDLKKKREKKKKKKKGNLEDMLNILREMKSKAERERMKQTQGLCNITGQF